MLGSAQRLAFSAFAQFPIEVRDQAAEPDIRGIAMIALVPILLDDV
jgi:hypothetical protein